MPFAPVVVIPGIPSLAQQSLPIRVGIEMRLELRPYARARFVDQAGAERVRPGDHGGAAVTLLVRLPSGGMKAELECGHALIEKRHEEGVALAEVMIHAAIPILVGR